MSIVNPGFTPVTPMVVESTPTTDTNTGATPTIIPMVNVFATWGFPSLGLRVANSSEDSAASLSNLALEIDSVLKESRRLRRLSLSARLSAAVNTMNSLSTEVSNLSAEKASAEAKLTQLNKDIGAANASVTSAKSTLEAANAKVAQLKGSGASADEISKAQSAADDAQQVYNKANSTLSGLQTQADAQTAIISRDQEALTDYNKAISAWSAAIDALNSQLADTSENGASDDAYLDALIQDANTLTVAIQAKAQARDRIADQIRRDNLLLGGSSLNAPPPGQAPSDPPPSFGGLTMQILNVTHAFLDLFENHPMFSRARGEDGFLTLRD